MTKTDYDLLRSLLLMASVVEARDPYTGGHLWRVSQMSHLLANHLDLPEEQQLRIKVGAYLHDLGKISVSDAVLHKKSDLTDREFSEIKTHPMVGFNLVQQHPLGGLVKFIIRHHHERLDGRGYPDNLNEDELDVGTKIVSICDAFDAMTSTRPYRKNMPIEEAVERLNLEKGKQFDGKMVSAFQELCERGHLNKVVLHSATDQSLLICHECGPTISINEDDISSHKSYCRVCGGEYSMSNTGGILNVKFTGNFAGLDVLSPKPDILGVDNFISNLPSDSDFLQVAG